MKKRDIKEIQRIQSSIPKELQERLMVNRKVTPTIERVVKEAMKSEEMSDERREQFKHLIDAGKFSVTERVVNKTVEKKIDKYIEDEMIKSVIAGRLTPPKNDTLLAKRIKKCKKNIQKSS